MDHVLPSLLRVVKVNVLQVNIVMKVLCYVKNVLRENFPKSKQACVHLVYQDIIMMRQVKLIVKNVKQVDMELVDQLLKIVMVTVLLELIVHTKLAFVFFVMQDIIQIFQKLLSACLVEEENIH